MKNKKCMEVSPLSLVIAAAILSAVLFVFFYAILPIFTGKQVPFLQGQTELTTSDCDEDGVLGVNDQCPCVKSIQRLELGKFCGEPNAIATKNCPALCKKK